MRLRSSGRHFANLKRKRYNHCILPFLNYSSETWQLTEDYKGQLRIALREMKKMYVGYNVKTGSKGHALEKTQVKG